LNPVEAASDTVRSTVMREIRSTLFSRFNKMSDSRFILIMQRLHEADPTGELLKDGGYHLVKLPAEAKTSVLIKLNDKQWKMDEGDLLTDRLSRKDLDQLRTDLTEYQYVGQYLQEPVPLGGGEFREEWIQFYPSGSIKPRTMNIYILVDAAGGDAVNKKKKKTSDFTSMAVIGLAPDNNYYLLDMVRDRLNPTERIETLFLLIRKWDELSGKKCKVGYEKYGIMADTHFIRKKMDEEGYRFPMQELGGQMQKEERIRRLIPDMQKGRWYFPNSLNYIDEEGRQFDLIKEIIHSEMASFPRAKFDDCLDSISRVLDQDLGAIFPRQAQSKVYNVNSENKDNWLAW